MPNLNYGTQGGENDVNCGTDEANNTNYDANGTDNEKKSILIDNIRKSSNITQNELMEILSLSRSTIQRIINELVNENRIKRIGSKRSGHWEIIE